jgi:hypothetical protein
MSFYRHKRRTAAALFATAAAAALLVLGIVGPAGATVIGHEHYAGEDTYTIDDCSGFTLNGVSQFEGVVHLRVVKGGEAFLVADNYSFRDVLTNPDTGKWFVIRGNGIFHETKATHVSGNVYDFTAIDSGQPFVMEDSSGNVVVRDRGTIRQTYLFDTLGDGVPGGELIEDTGLVVRGPHPAFADDFPFCELAAKLTGV